MGSFVAIDEGRSKGLRSARHVPAGHILKQELEERGQAECDLAAFLGCPEQAINEIILGSKRITPATSLVLSQMFGTSPEFWHKLDVAAQE